VENIDTYEQFTIANFDAWIAINDPKLDCAAQNRIDEMIEAILKDIIVEIYFIRNNSNENENYISRKAKVIEIKYSTNKTSTPDIYYTPDNLKNITSELWIKVSRMRNYKVKKIENFIDISTEKMLNESIGDLQYNFGLIEEL